MEAVESKKIKEVVDRISQEVRKVIVEQDEIIEHSVIGLLCGGHILLEGVPGLAKTLLVRALSKTISGDFKRIQFTPDLMPSDVTGTKIYNMQSREFELKKGPVFANLLLADEINRTPPKTQAGLLEAMAEQTVSIGGDMLSLPEPYMVFATQNPIEYEGTYPLPEALVDRFLMKLYVNYPSVEGEKEIILRQHKGFKSVKLETSGIETVCSLEEIIACKEAVAKISIQEELVKYIVEIVASTRNNSFVDIGSSPRGSLAILETSKAYAAICGRDYVIPEDIKKMAVPCLRHRVILKPEVEMEGMKVESVLEDILSKVKVPR